MATNTLPVFTANSPTAPWEPTFTVSYPHEGTVYVVGFSSIYELTNLLVGECCEGRLVEQIIDFAEESLEWQQKEYPLFQPPDAVTIYNDPVCSSPHAVKPSPFWEWAAATLRVGAITAPWVVVGIIGRFLYGLAVAWWQA